MPTRIEWATEVWNPIVGCRKISPGCAHCYAAAFATRHAANATMPQYAGVAAGGEWTGKVGFSERALGQLATWRKPRRIFVDSMCDVFYEQVPLDWIDAVLHATLRSDSAHRFLLLTKRPKRMVIALSSWPVLRRVWLGVSVENQRFADERLPRLAQLRCRGWNTFVSVEPLLGPVDLTHGLPSLGWVIAGGESGPGARPCELDWLRSIRDQCHAAGVPFFLKQLGGYPHKRGGEEALLDGRLWRQIPEALLLPGEEHEHA